MVVYYAIANLKLNNSRRKWKPNAKLVKPDYAWGVYSGTKSENRKSRDTLNLAKNKKPAICQLDSSICM